MGSRVYLSINAFLYVNIVQRFEPFTFIFRYIFSFHSFNNNELAICLAGV